MKCGFCHSPLTKEVSLSQLLRFSPVVFNEYCLSCSKELSRLNKEAAHCQYCQKELAVDSNICDDCHDWEKQLTTFSLKHDYLFSYNEKMKTYFQHYKFLGDIHLSRVFASDIQEGLRSYQQAGFIIVPIPLSKKKLRKRGFNQVEGLLTSSDIPFTAMMSKKETLVSQSEKSKEERLASKQPFFISNQAKRKIKGQKILLIDDVYTTGRTILHAYDCLLPYKPKEIRSFSLSR